MTKSDHPITQKQPAFSYPVKIGHISLNPVDVHLEADQKELEALARQWNVLSVEMLKADVQIGRWERDGIRVKGVLMAKLTQACVVTLDPVPSHIREEFEQLFVPEGSKLARMPTPQGEMLLDPEGPDVPDIFTGDTIDIGDVVSEFAALAIDPYPRRHDVEFGDHIEDKGDERKPSPFAVLKDWKKD